MELVVALKSPLLGQLVLVLMAVLPLAVVLLADQEEQFGPAKLPLVECVALPVRARPPRVPALRLQLDEFSKLL